LPKVGPLPVVPLLAEGEDQLLEIHPGPLQLIGHQAAGHLLPAAINQSTHTETVNFINFASYVFSKF